LVALFGLRENIQIFTFGLPRLYFHFPDVVSGHTCVRLEHPYRFEKLGFKKEEFYYIFQFIFQTEIILINIAVRCSDIQCYNICTIVLNKQIKTCCVILKKGEGVINGSYTFC